MKNYTAQEVYDLLKAGSITLVDVREADEYAAAHIEGAVLCPLSSFDPCKVPDVDAKPVVFHCAGGVRSAMVIKQCQAAAQKHDAHMEGGIKAWIAAGLPTVKS